MDERVKQAALETAAHILQYRNRSRQALYDRLLEKGVPEEAAAYAVARLRELDYLHDFEYGKALLRDLAARGYGARRIRMALREKNLEPEDIEAVMAEYVPDESRLRILAAAKLEGQIPDRKTLKRTADSLFRRGFSWEEIRAVLRDYAAMAEDGDDDRIE